MLKNNTSRTPNNNKQIHIVQQKTLSPLYNVKLQEKQDQPIQQLFVFFTFFSIFAQPKYSELWNV